MFSIMSQIRAKGIVRISAILAIAAIACTSFVSGAEARGTRKVVPVQDQGDSDGVGGIKFYETPGLPIYGVRIGDTQPRFIVVPMVPMLQTPVFIIKIQPNAEITK